MSLHALDRADADSDPVPGGYFDPVHGHEVAGFLDKMSIRSVLLFSFWIFGFERVFRLRILQPFRLNMLVERTPRLICLDYSVAALFTSKAH